MTIFDLLRSQNAEYEVIDDSQEHWWKVKDGTGNIGYIPSNYVKEKELLGLQKYEYVVIRHCKSIFTSVSFAAGTLVTCHDSAPSRC